VRAFKAIVIAVGVIVAVIVGGGLALGRDWRAERSILMRAPPTAVHARLVDLARWAEWAAGERGRDPACTWTHDGAPGRAGSFVAWQGEPCGEGKIVLADSHPERGVWLDDYVGARGRAERTGRERFELTREGTATRVTWIQEGRSPAIAGGWLTGFVERRLGEHMDESLARLARAIEGADRVDAPAAGEARAPSGEEG
jgi:hypothetical protein